MSYIKFKNLLESIQKRDPEFSVKFKDQSKFMKFLGVIMFFNSSFMTSYVTTIGKTVYFPNEESLKSADNYGCILTLAHEYRHAKDYDNNKVLFILSYLFPQILAPLMLIMMIASIWISWIAFFVLLALFLITLSPIPARGRKYWEMRGSVVSLFVRNEIHKRIHGDKNMGIRQEIMNNVISRYNKKFTGPDYYFMWPFGVEDELQTYLSKIYSGDLVKQDPFLNDLSLDINRCWEEE
jgi:hypothetical protein